MPIKPKAEHKARMTRDVRTLQETLLDCWLNDSVPDAWHGLVMEFEPKQVNVELALDEDMIAWFRRQGSNFEKIINLILRVYWRGIMSGELRPHYEPEVYGPTRDRFLASLLGKHIQEMRREGAASEDIEALTASFEEACRVLKKGDPLGRAVEKSAKEGESEAGLVSD